MEVEMFQGINRFQKNDVKVAAVLIGILLLVMAVSVSAQYQVRKPGGAATEASIQVTGPAGGQTWEKGKRYEITWSSDGVKGGSVKIELIDGNGKATALVRQTVNNGKCSASLPHSLDDGDYRIRISTVDGKTSGESSGTVHVGKATGSESTTKSTGIQPKTYTPPPVKTKPEATPDETQTKSYTPPATTTKPEVEETAIKPKTYTPPPVKTPTSTVTRSETDDEVVAETKTTPVTTTATAAVTLPDKTATVTPDVVRLDFNATQVPIAELQVVNLPSIAPTLTIQPTRPSRLLPAMIDVTAPVADAAWQAGESQTIRWASNDLKGPVKIDLINVHRGTDDVVHYSNIPVVASTDNDGAYEYVVPERLGYHSRYYVCEVSSLDGQTKDQSPAYFDVYTEPVDMSCQVVNLSLKTDHDRYPFYIRPKNGWNLMSGFATTVRDDRLMP